MKKLVVWATLILLSSACSTGGRPEMIPTLEGQPENILPVQQTETEVEESPRPTISPTTTESQQSDLPVLREAPELVNEVWLNTDKPLRLADLRGQVVLLDMWTFG